MYTGTFAGDMAVSGALNRAEIAEAKLRQAYADEAEQDLTIAGHLGMRSALSSQLAMYDPENPLLTDTSLQERIKAAAKTAFKLAKNHFDAAREAGRTFKIPGREKPVAPKTLVQPPDLLKIKLEEMKEAHASSLALRSALAEQLRKLDPDNPILKDLMLIERVRNGGVAAYRLTGENFDAARKAGETFKIPGR